MSLPHWKGLLKWSLSKTDHKKKKEEVKPMSKEDMAFLEGAMSSVHEHEREISSCVADVNRIAKSLTPQPSPQALSDDDKERVLECLSKLQEHFEDHPSNASSVVKLGLLESFTLLLNAEDSEVLEATLSIISCTMSNNESILDDVAKSTLIPDLLKLRERLKESPLEPKLVSALSSAVRNCPKGEHVFTMHEGLTYLKECLKSNNKKTRERAILLLTHFVSLDRVGKLVMARLDPYAIVKMLLPIDPEANGIQFSELACTLISLLVEKHRDTLTEAEKKEVSDLLDQELKSLDALGNADYDTVRAIFKSMRRS